MLILLKLFQKTEKGNSSKLTLCNQHHPDNKTRLRVHKKRKLQASIPDEQRCKNVQQKINKPTSINIKRITHHNQLGFIPGV